MSQITIARYAPHTSGPLITAQLIECYRDVFAVEPWHEWLQCQVCKSFWGKKDMELLSLMQYRHCEKPLVDYWARDRVYADFQHEVTPEASCWLAMDGDKVIGFCLGYPITVAKLEKKLGISFGFQISHTGSDIVAYQDDVLVDPGYRNQGHAKNMVSRRHDDFMLQGLKHGIVRTRQYPEPSVTFLWYMDLGYEIIARYLDNDGRVILGRQLEGLKEHLMPKVLV